MGTRQAGDEGAPAPGQAVLSSGSLRQLEHRFGSVTSKVPFGKKAIASTFVRTMMNKNQRVECCGQTISKEWITEKSNGHLNLEDDMLMPRAALQG